MCKTGPSSRLRCRIVVQKLPYMSKASVVIRNKFVPDCTAWSYSKIGAFVSLYISGVQDFVAHLACISVLHHLPFLH